jgi:hypothetical protein
MEARLISEEWLHLHAQDDDEPMRKLKISLDAFVCAEEARLNGTLIGATFFVLNDVIERASLTGDLSEKTRCLLESRLVGVPLKRWREVIEPLITFP